MQYFEKNAVLNVELRAKETEIEDKNIIEKIIKEEFYHYINADFLVSQILNCCDVTLNFHPDRFSNNGNMIIQNLINEGIYQSQFLTGTTNGGKTAYPNGDRDIWEKNMFKEAYHSGVPTYHSRPKYGALNLMKYLDGAAARFGSCFFTLKTQVMERCTFTFGDSVTNPDTFGTKNSFWGILRAIMLNVKENKKFFDNKGCFSVKEVIEYLSSLKREPLFKIGKNLDDYIEAQIHGEINLINDVDCFYIDESFKNTEINGQAEILSEKYDIKLFWIPQRKIHVNNIGNEFRGSAIPILARKIISKFNIETEYINAEIIGRASRDSILNPKEWSDLGTEQELFQYMKQLWHTVAYFG